jgi:hypothetical protein
MKKNLNCTNLPTLAEQEVIDNNHEFIAANHTWVLNVLANCEKNKIPANTIKRFIKYFLNEKEVTKGDTFI